MKWLREFLDEKQNNKDKAESWDELCDIVSEEMMKSDDESDLCIIGEKVLEYLGY